MWRFASWVVLAAALTLMVAMGSRYEAVAQDATPTPAPESYDIPTDVPETLPAILERIAELQAKIKELTDKADGLVYQNEQDEKQRLRQQVKSLKMQVKILERRRDQLSNAVSEADIEAIREKYRAEMRAYEAEMTRIRRETIQRYEARLSRDPTARVAPDILWRLANLYFEEAHAEYLESWDSYEASMDQLYTRGDINAVPEEPRHNYARSVELLRTILRDFPDYPKKDNVLYLLAYCYQEQNDDDNALLVYGQLIKEAPQSNYVPESYVRMGEISFDRDQFDRAIERYQQVLNYKQSKFYDKALYKLGWSYYKLSNYEQAVYYFTAVLEYYKGRASRARGRGTADDLRQESVDYIAISFTEAEGLEGGAAAVSFMDKIGDRELGRQILVKVGEVYDERTDYEAARNAYRAYIKEFPLAPEIPEVYQKIAVTYEKQAMFEEAVEVYTQIGEQLGADSAWAQANAKQAKAVQRAGKLRQSSILAAATFHHEKAQQTSGEEAQAHYQKAITNYLLYLESYAGAKGSYEAAFNLAECYMETRDYPKAAEWYQKVVDRKEDKELYQDSLFNNAKAWELQLEGEGGLPNKEALEERKKQAAAAEGDQAKGVEIKATPLSETTRSWIAALELHVQLLPDSDKSPTMLYKIGEIYYLHREFDKAREYFDKVFVQYPNNQVVAFAAFYYLDTSKQDGDWPGFREALNRIPSGGAIPEEQKFAVLAGATFKIAEQMLRDATASDPADPQKVQAAINEFLQGVQQHPSDTNADAALLNVAVAYENHLRDLVSANDNYRRLATTYPQSKHAPTALLKAAYNYQVLVEFELATEAYEEFVRLFPDHKEAGNSLFNAAALREENGQYMQAVSLYQQYLGRYASETDAAQVSFTIGRLYEKISDTNGAMNAYTEYAKRGPDDAARMSEAYFRWGKLLEERGNYGEAEKRYLQSVAVFVKAKQVDPQTNAAFAAESQFRIADHYYQEYKAMVFTGNMQRDSQVLKTKAEMFKKLKVYYEEVVTFGNYKWATASLHMIGMINQEFSEALLTAPVPEDLDPEMQDEYVFKLEEIAFPIKNRALEAFKQNVQKGIDERLINDWIVQSYLQLKKLEPATVEPKFEVPDVAERPAFAMADLDGEIPAMPAPPTVPGTTPPATTPPTGGGGQQLAPADEAGQEVAQ